MAQNHGGELSPVTEGQRLQGLRDILNAHGVQSPPPRHDVFMPVIPLDIAYGHVEFAASPGDEFGDLPQRVAQGGFADLPDYGTAMKRAGRAAYDPSGMPEQDITAVFDEANTVHHLNNLGSSFMGDRPFTGEDPDPADEVDTDEDFARRQEARHGWHQRRVDLGMQVARVMFTDNPAALQDAVEQAKQIT